MLGEEWVFINPSTSSQSLTITSSNTATIVTIVPGSTIRVNALVASPSAPSDWVLNSLGNTVGPGSSVDNAIVRFDGTTGKLVQNSGVEIDDSGNIKMSYASGALGRVNYQAASGDKVFLLQTITSTNNYGIGVDSGNLVTLGSVSGADTWNVKAIQYASSGAVTLGPSGFSGTHTLNGGATVTGGTAANNTMYVASNVLRLRGGTSGLGFNNSSGTETGSVTDAGSWALGVTGSNTARLYLNPQTTLSRHTQLQCASAFSCSPSTTYTFQLPSTSHAGSMVLVQGYSSVDAGIAAVLCGFSNKALVLGVTSPGYVSETASPAANKIGVQYNSATGVLSVITGTGTIVEIGVSAISITL